MHGKVLRHGTGSIRAGIKYALRPTDWKGKPREHLELLKGDPDLAIMIGEGIDRKWKYSSLVISFHPSDRPTKAQKMELIEAYEEIMFAGMGPTNRSPVVWVDHGDDMHAFIPRAEMSTGKAFNPFPPGWQKTYDPIRDYFNLKYGWKSPDIERHPENKRIHTPGNLHKLPKGVKKAKEAIHQAVTERIEAGEIKNADDVRAFLSAAVGEITREGKDYISVKPEGFKKPIRLKGVIYGREFELDRAIEEVRAAQEARAGRTPKDDERELQNLSKQLEEIYHRRAAYHRERYKIDQAENRRSATQRRRLPWDRGEGRDPAEELHNEDSRSPGSRSHDRGDPGGHDVAQPDHGDRLAKGKQPGKRVVYPPNEVTTTYQTIIFFRIYRHRLPLDESYYVTDLKDGRARLQSRKKGVDVTDQGDRITGSGRNIREEAKLMIEMAKAKGWPLETLVFRGSPEFIKVAQEMRDREIAKGNQVKQNIAAAVAEHQKKKSNNVTPPSPSLPASIRKIVQEELENSAPAEVAANIEERIGFGNWGRYHEAITDEISRYNEKQKNEIAAKQLAELRSKELKQKQLEAAVEKAWREGRQAQPQRAKKSQGISRSR